MEEKSSNWFGWICLIGIGVALVVASKQVPSKHAHEIALRQWVTEKINAADAKDIPESAAKLTAEIINARYRNDPDANYLEFFGFDYNTYGVLSVAKGKGDIMFIGAFDHVWALDLSKWKSKS